MMEWSNGSNDAHRLLLVTIIIDKVDGIVMSRLSNCSRPIGVTIKVMSWEYRRSGVTTR